MMPILNPKLLRLSTVEIRLSLGVIPGSGNGYIFTTARMGESSVMEVAGPVRAAGNDSPSIWDVLHGGVDELKSETEDDAA